MQRMHDEQTQETNEAKASFQNQAIDKKRFIQMLAKQSNEIAELKSVVLDVLKSVKKIERALAEKDLNIAKKDRNCDDLFSFDPKLAKIAAESEK